jgi:hypothetical protein
MADKQETVTVRATILGQNDSGVLDVRINGRPFTLRADRIVSADGPLVEGADVVLELPAWLVTKAAM